MPPKPKPRRRGVAWLPCGSIAIATLLAVMRLQLAHEAESEPRIGGVAVRRQSPGRTHLRRRARPRSASDRALAAARVDPGLAVSGGAPIPVVPAIGDPLADVAAQVVKVECIGRVAPGRRRAPEPIRVVLEGVAPVTPGR